MSESVSYLSEPPTHGKVVFHTTFGDLDVELFSSSAPHACRLFTALCLRHHYDGLPFHRLIPHFLAQTGDRPLPPLPSSIAPPPKPELHSRLRFNRRGLLGLAAPASAAGVDSGQWFVTLRAAEELTGQHVLFGKVTGETVYNLGRLDEVEVRGEEPVNAPRVRSVEVLLCPWEGMREEAEREEAEARERRKAEEAKARRAEGGGRLGKKNVQLLSFAADADDEASAPAPSEPRKGKGIHAVLTHDVRVVRVEEEKEKRTAEERTLQAVKDKLHRDRVPDRPADPISGPTPAAQRREETKETAMDELDDAEYDAAMRAKALQSSSRNAEPPPPIAAVAAPSSAASLKAQVRQLTREVLGGGAAEVAPTKAAASEGSTGLSALDRRLQPFLSRKKSALAASASSTLERLAQFRSAIQALPAPPPPPSAPSSTYVPSTSAVDEAYADEGDDAQTEKGKGWLRHRLTFARRPQDFVKEDSGAFEVLDPRGLEGSKGQGPRMGRGGRDVEALAKRGREKEESQRRRRADSDDDGALPAELQREVDALTGAKGGEEKGEEGGISSKRTRRDVEAEKRIHRPERQ